MNIFICETFAMLVSIVIKREYRWSIWSSRLGYIWTSRIIHCCRTSSQNGEVYNDIANVFSVSSSDICKGKHRIDYYEIHFDLWISIRCFVMRSNQLCLARLNSIVWLVWSMFGFLLQRCNKWNKLHFYCEECRMWFMMTWASKQ